MRIALSSIMIPLVDAIIVGAGPAGLSAALILARCCRSILLFDSGRPRNASARAIHGFLSRDGTTPETLRRLGRAELAQYGVEVQSAEVIDARSLQSDPSEFEVVTADGERCRGRKLLLATGLRDILPAIPGLRQFYGGSVHHCPYCDGWEHRGSRMVAYGRGSAAVGLAVALTAWSDRVIACTDDCPVSEEDQVRLANRGLAWRNEAVVRLEGVGNQLERVVFANGPTLECDCLFFNTGQFQGSPLLKRLGCELSDAGPAVARDKHRTTTPGLFLAGDADQEVQFSIVAAAEGATAGAAINRELQDEACWSPAVGQLVEG
jgi:thioredoxin reductase